MVCAQVPVVLKESVAGHVLAKFDNLSHSLVYPVLQCADLELNKRPLLFCLVLLVTSPSTSTLFSSCPKGRHRAGNPKLGVIMPCDQ